METIEMGRYRNNPYYDPGALFRKLMDSVVEDYLHPSKEDEVPFVGTMKITVLARKHRISVLKARKLLVIAGVMETEQGRAIRNLSEQGLSTKEICEVTGLSIATVNSWMPYL